MVVKATERVTEIRNDMHGGTGSVGIAHILSNQQLPFGYRMCAEVILEKGCGIGKHAHANESEIFYVLSGEVVYSDNGNDTVLKVGDTCVCYCGENHGVRNEKSLQARLLAVIIKQG